MYVTFQAAGLTANGSQENGICEADLSQDFPDAKLGFSVAGSFFIQRL
jgi:hypothetical protein